MFCARFEQLLLDCSFDLSAGGRPDTRIDCGPVEPLSDTLEDTKFDVLGSLRFIRSLPWPSIFELFSAVPRTTSIVSRDC